MKLVNAMVQKALVILVIGTSLLLLLLYKREFGREVVVLERLGWRLVVEVAVKLLRLRLDCIGRSFGFSDFADEEAEGAVGGF